MPAKKSLLDLVFEFRADLVEHVKVLEDGNSGPGRRYDAAVAATTLICQDLGEFISYRMARLPEIAKRHRPKDDGAGGIGRSRSQEDMAACDRIGRALEAHVSRRWEVADSLADLYRQLLDRAQHKEFRPLVEADLPAGVRRFHKKACAEADKLRKAGRLSDDGSAVASTIAKKAVGVALAVGGLIGLEQDILPFRDDLVAFVEVMVHAVEELSLDEGFVPEVPELLERPEVLAREPDGPARKPDELAREPEELMREAEALMREADELMREPEPERPPEPERKLEPEQELERPPEPEREPEPERDLDDPWDIDRL